MVDIGPAPASTAAGSSPKGTPAHIMPIPSLTGAYLSGAVHRRPAPGGAAPIAATAQRSSAPGQQPEERHPDEPVGLFTCVTGVSGSGKSTLINDTLYAPPPAPLYGSSGTRCRPTARGPGIFDKVINVDQSPIGRTPRSNPATYTGLLFPIREWFAGVPKAKPRGYGPGRFSFNVKGGRCEACQGDGVIKVEMHFLPDVYVPCDVCHGKRYNRETLESNYKGRNIADEILT